MKKLLMPLLICVCVDACAQLIITKETLGNYQTVSRNIVGFANLQERYNVRLLDSIIVEIAIEFDIIAGAPDYSKQHLNHYFYRSWDGKIGEMIIRFNSEINEWEILDYIIIDPTKADWRAGARIF